MEESLVAEHGTKKCFEHEGGVRGRSRGGAMLAPKRHITECCVHPAEEGSGIDSCLRHSAGHPTLPLSLPAESAVQELRRYQMSGGCGLLVLSLVKLMAPLCSSLPPAPRRWMAATVFGLISGLPAFPVCVCYYE